MSSTLLAVEFDVEFDVVLSVTELPVTVLPVTELSGIEATLLLGALAGVAGVATVTLAGAGSSGMGSSPRAAKTGAASPMAAMPAVVQMSDRFMLVSPWGGVLGTVRPPLPTDVPAISKGRQSLRAL
jgi:hypothetical protein